jgi:hypothetical protein
MTTPTANTVDVQLPHFDAGTIQRVVIYATPQTTYDAIWSADLLRAPLARMLTRASVAVERAGARVRGTSGPRRVPRSTRLGDMLGAESPWLLLADEPGHEVVLGLRALCGAHAPAGAAGDQGRGRGLSASSRKAMTRRS